jgi:tellurite resistance protein TerC
LRAVSGASTAAWIIFGVTVAAAVVADLVVFRPRDHRVTLKRALIETAAWVALSVCFGIWIYLSRGHQPAADFFTAYVLEKSLSADNIFIFLLIFRAFNVASNAQHRVLYSGIAGALVFRLAFVIAGIALLHRFHFVLYLFGAVLLVAGVHMLWPRKQGPDPEGSWIIRFVRKIIPVAAASDGDRLFVRQNGRWLAAPPLLALVAIETSDIIFAADSVPAVLAITRDPFIAYSSNVFAILGLRAMYFGLAALMDRMRFLHHGLGGVLLFVGLKMMVAEKFPISSEVSLVVIAAILSVAAAASWLTARSTRP